MAITIRLQDIDEAIENLRYKSEATLKSRLLRAVRHYYADDAASESLQIIDTEELVKTIWETGDDRELLKTKRKNFSSLKSSVNADLKKLYADGKNPQGIVIGSANVFAISDEAKDKALAGIMDAFKEKGIDTTSKITDILSALGDVLSSAVSNTAAIDAKDEIERLKQIMGGLSDKMGLSFQDIIKQAVAAGGESTGGGAATEMPGYGQDLAGFIQDGISTIDQGLAKLTKEDAGAGDAMQEAVKAALSDIVSALKDTETENPAKARQIMAAVLQMIGKAIDASGTELSGDQANQLKQIFHEMSAGAGGAPPVEEIREATDQLAKDQLLSNVSAILSGEGLSAGDKISQIMAAVNNMMEEALAESGLSGEELAQIKEMMGNITGNLEAFAHEVLAEEDIIEEVIEEGADEAVEVVVEETAADAVPSEGADITEVVQDLIEEVVSESVGDVVELEGEEAPPAGPDEIVEVIEEVAGEVEGPAAEEAQVSDASDEGVEVAVEELIAEDAAGEALSDGIGSSEGAEIAEAGQELIEEVVSESVGDVLEIEGEEALTAGPDEIVEVIEEVAGEVEGPAAEETQVLDASDEGVEVAVEELVTEDVAGAAVADEVGSAEVAEAAAFAEDEMIEVVEDDAVPEEMAQTTEAVDSAEGVVEEISDQDVIEEIVEESPGAEGAEGDEGASIQVVLSEKPVDEELREKTNLLTRLAEAAGMLEKLGPDLSGSVYTEEELRSKAKFLSEEFDRYLSLRDKFFNAHILIKGGPYLVGGAHLIKSELEEQVAALADFYIGKFPVTNALFEIFVEQTGYVTTAEKFGYGLVYFPRMQRSRDPVTGTERFVLNSQAYYKRVAGACWHHPHGPDSTLHLKRTHPVVQVSLEDARAYAAWTGKRLPTEIEWEAAARTPRGNIFPWGNEWQEDACNIEKSLHGDTTPVDAYIKFANAAEVADMLGNVLEWTIDVVGDKDTSETHIVKGASWVSHGEVSLTDRHYIEKSTSSNIIGFRCVAI